MRAYDLTMKNGAMTIIENKGRKVKRVLFAIIAATMGGCVTLSGNYVVSAVDAKGEEINTVFFAQGRQIYTARNAICAAHPKATVHIRSAETKKDLEGESPYRCR